MHSAGWRVKGREREPRRVRYSKEENGGGMMNLRGVKRAGNTQPHTHTVNRTEPQLSVRKLI